MTQKFRFFHRARVRAPIAVAWDVFTNHERMPEFTNTPCKIITPGSPDPNGLGCIRDLGVFEWTVREVINIWRPYDVYGYHVIESKQVSIHQGVIRFFPTNEGGCEWVYDMQSAPSAEMAEQLAASGQDWRTTLAPSFAEWMTDLEAECERRADKERVQAWPHSTSDLAIYKD